MSDFLTSPPWQREDLGLPLPDSPHAVSVSLPLWEHVVGYEEGDVTVLNAMRTGYPRFFMPRVVVELCDRVAEAFGGEGEKCLLFPTMAAAERCATFIRDRHDGWSVRTGAISGMGVFATWFPQQVESTARRYWRFCGEIIGSRQAVNLVNDREAGAAASRVIRERLAKYSGQSADDVYLFPSGMAAVAATHRMLCEMFPGQRTEQFDFPYVDVLKVQEEFGSGVSFHPVGDAAALDALEQQLNTEMLAGVYCEIPSNPCLRSADLKRLKALTLANSAVLIIDDTVGSSVNVDAFRYADVATTSLTKFFSGVGDVIAGAVTLSVESLFYAEMKAFFEKQVGAELWWEDAVALEKNSRDYEARVRKMNANAEALCEYLRTHPAVDEVYFPKWVTRENYDAMRREDGGYGALFSLLLKAPEVNAPRFFDALRVAKGPSLGTEFTIACPYTLLAHYTELEWAEECGVSRWLVRVSVGLEDAEDLIERFRIALGVA
jgi:cystathionine gamma-synthase